MVKCTCGKLACFNIRGETKALFCSQHKEPHMTDVKHKTCEIDGCEARPIYNIRGEKKARFCSQHKEPNMVNVKSRTCQMVGCYTQPTYNIRGQIRARFCYEHKEPNMINIKNKTCEMDGCDILPTYNIRGQVKARFCYEHKELNMVNVKSKICEADECKILCRYGFLGKGLSRCSSHRQKGMITSPNRICETTSCNNLGAYEHNGIRYCEDHKPIEAENLGIYKCSSCGLDDILTNGKCSTCDPIVLQIRRHAKENRVGDVFKVNGLDTFVHDKMLEGPICGRERPDYQFDCGTHFVYVEVDEHQHRSYACECEQTRMINLVEARGMPVRFIRYNPDAYEPVKGQRKVKLEQREKKLVEYVKYAIQNSPKDIANVLYLFYDEYDTTIQTWDKLI